MKLALVRTALLILAAALTSLVFQNCTPGGGQSSETASSTALVDNSPWSTPDPTVTPIDSTRSLPAMTIKASPCVKNQLCTFTFKLDRAAAEDVSFDFRTNDLKYQSLASVVVNNKTLVTGRAGVHYTAVGTMNVKIAAGQTQVVVSVQAMNPSDSYFYIPILYSNCMYGTNYLNNCSELN